MPISNALRIPALVGSLQWYTGSGMSGNGYVQLHDGKWLYLTNDAYRTIGNSASGSNSAYDWLYTLYVRLALLYPGEVLWYNSSGVQVSSLSTPISNWESNYRLRIPDFRGRGLIGAGQGSSLTNRVRGSFLGAETHALSVAELPSHNHSISNIITVTRTPTTGTANTASVSGAGSTGNAGSGQAHNNMQPSRVENLLIATGVL